MEPSLEGVRAKIDRAKEHVRDLEVVITSFCTPHAQYAVTSDGKTERINVKGTIVSVNPVPWRARVLMGDAIHSLAAALDHLVYQLSLVNTKDAALCDSHKTYFPIYPEDTTDAQKGIRRKLALVGREAADLIRSMQPYNRQKRADPLWVLYQLDVIDKHRLILAAETDIKLTNVSLSTTEMVLELFNDPDAPWQPLEENAPLIDCAIVGMSDEAFKKQPKFNTDATVRVSFAETGLICDGYPAVGLLAELVVYVESVIKRFERFFPATPDQEIPPA